MDTWTYGFFPPQWMDGPCFEAVGKPVGAQRKVNPRVVEGVGGLGPRTHICGQTQIARAA